MAETEYLPGGIRERMEDLRNRRKLTLKEVAEKTGIDYSISACRTFTIPITLPGWSGANTTYPS